MWFAEQPLSCIKITIEFLCSYLNILWLEVYSTEMQKESQLKVNLCIDRVLVELSGYFYSFDQVLFCPSTKDQNPLKKNDCILQKSILLAEWMCSLPRFTSLE
jgi:hypothetical protein